MPGVFQGLIIIRKGAALENQVGLCALVGHVKLDGEPITAFIYFGNIGNDFRHRLCNLFQSAVTEKFYVRKCIHIVYLSILPAHP